MYFDLIRLPLASAVLPPTSPLFPKVPPGPGSPFHPGIWQDAQAQKLLNECLL